MQASVMKHFIAYLLCLRACTVAFATNGILKPHNKTAHNDLRLLKFPDDKGVIHVFKASAIPDAKCLSKIGEFTNQYLLFTRANSHSYETLTINDANSINSSHFNARNPTVVVVHGWMSDRNSNINLGLRSAFIMKGDFNVIVLDWSRVADEDYITAVAAVPHIGRYLGKFLTFLTSTTGVPISSLHLIGHSLGAHVVGNAGKELKGRVGRITGLDPAGPLWDLNIKRLSQTDAIYVEAIHTNAGIFGIIDPVAKVDFYANGGFDQPGCITDVCSHERSWKLFASSLLNDHFVGHQCSNLLQFSLNTCNGAVMNFGNDELVKSGNITNILVNHSNPGDTPYQEMVHVNSRMVESTYHLRNYIKVRSGVYRLKTAKDFPY